jgi:hypothetical protein
LNKNSSIKGVFLTIPLNFPKAAINPDLKSVFICEYQALNTGTEANWEGSKMIRKVTADIKAALVLIVTENVKAVRTGMKNLASSVYKFFTKSRKGLRQNSRKRTSLRKG